MCFNILQIWKLGQMYWILSFTDGFIESNNARYYWKEISLIVNIIADKC